jgi:hypothetical protein
LLLLLTYNLNSRHEITHKIQFAVRGAPIRYIKTKGGTKLDGIMEICLRLVASYYYLVWFPSVPVVSDGRPNAIMSPPLLDPIVNT